MRRILPVLLLLVAAVSVVPGARASDGSATYFPQGWTTASTDVGVHISDSGSGLDLTRTTLYVDDEPILTAYDWAHGLLHGHVDGLAAGHHEASVYAIDRAGNSMTFTWDFAVDDVAPAVGPGSPAGITTDRTPELVIPAVDSDSGIASTTLWLDNGVLAGRLSATYDPATSTIRYQVPEIPRGVGPGHYPLIDGRYVAELEVLDVAGNSTLYEWAFEVRTFPV